MRHDHGYDPVVNLESIEVQLYEYSTYHDWGLGRYTMNDFYQLSRSK